ncbi:hypothetical protein GOV10_02655 [Candidatus Woesearchaeota archaeon]|nr:hypothetical protein [Candidatus Woesearchaeota archaeon]
METRDASAVPRRVYQEFGYKTLGILNLYRSTYSGELIDKEREELCKYS